MNKDVVVECALHAGDAFGCGRPESTCFVLKRGSGCQNIFSSPSVTPERPDEYMCTLHISSVRNRSVGEAGEVGEGRVQQAGLESSCNGIGIGNSDHVRPSRYQQRTERRA